MQEYNLSSLFFSNFFFGTFSGVATIYELKNTFSTKNSFFYVQYLEIENIIIINIIILILEIFLLIGQTKIKNTAFMIKRTYLLLVEETLIQKPTKISKNKIVWSWQLTSCLEFSWKTFLMGCIFHLEIFVRTTSDKRCAEIRVSG